MDINNINPAGRENLDKLNHKNLDRLSLKKDLKEENKQSVYEITGESKKYIELSNRIPEVREDLVNKLKDAIKNGNYKVDIESIVNKMFE
ncbi:flagellar biosynthesis anti-sigma factor FlgM [Petrotoga sp. 9PW.55.5.1]|uniref:flagellar biosynthesis anti-sigma factor FlgM n=1 Tax=Petrotoga sp. 9PW.55.5.1 TaxID=1308979 RepID=UPI000DD6A92A|nr:flagellar biosynthesis anti-sigma factor FlgM [Petrotoga sp. 9PW.55.5.1]